MEFDRATSRFGPVLGAENPRESPRASQRSKPVTHKALEPPPAPLLAHLPFKMRFKATRLMWSI